MAFYADELSPIDRIRTLGKSSDYPDINLLKNRRHWKSLVLGKKDMGLANFATITEEKEEDFSSDGSLGVNSDKGSNGSLVETSNKKISFPKPQKHIITRVAERKELALRTLDSPVPSSPVRISKEPINGEVKKTICETPTKLFSNAKPNLPDFKQLIKNKKDSLPKSDFTERFALNQIPMEAQWNEAIANPAFLTGWQTTGTNNDSPKEEPPNTKCEAKKKPQPVGAVLKVDNKATKKKSILTKKPNILPDDSKKKLPLKPKLKADKNKTLNMKEVVNVYKNLAYGSKDEIKSFVENLSLVDNENENDKNLLSVKNLKALENKIKNFTKKGSKVSEEKSSPEKKCKKPLKKNRKAHIDRLARHKVIKVPAALSKEKLNNNSDTSKTFEEKKRNSSNKEPWKYTGMSSVLDKTYFVYPAHTISAPTKKKKTKPKATPTEEKKEVEAPPPIAKTATTTGPKVKAPAIVIKQNNVSKTNPTQKIRTSTTTSLLNVSSSISNKSMNRPSATTVCTVEFRPNPVEGHKPTDPSLLVYLHGMKALNVKTPYSDKQFSRVKFFRKDEKEFPLIKGLDRKAFFKNYPNVSIRNISLPEKLSRIRSLDLLDFDEDIEQINDFLHSLNSPRQKRQEEKFIKSERDQCPKETPRDTRQFRQNTNQHQHHHHHHHQHGTVQEQLSPDSIINEISKHVQHMQYLPDTEENRKLIAEFFEELDHRIEESRNVSNFPKFSSPRSSISLIPILGY